MIRFAIIIAIAITHNASVTPAYRKAGNYWLCSVTAPCENNHGTRVVMMVGNGEHEIRRTASGLSIIDLAAQCHRVGMIMVTPMTSHPVCQQVTRD